ncbi:hypothetical protein H920_16295 [Fukomys damarensis]|uniref:Uncharacterized protein n=1 Tax=Fukomys damarensis TaxID=885580 RepID=A0A091CSG7_FUKDA|nr:hypothetical protein H920_16295 [Fukomys damarensis]
MAEGLAEAACAVGVCVDQGTLWGPREGSVYSELGPARYQASANLAGPLVGCSCDFGPSLLILAPSGLPPSAPDKEASGTFLSPNCCLSKKPGSLGTCLLGSPHQQQECLCSMPPNWPRNCLAPQSTDSCLSAPHCCPHGDTVMSRVVSAVQLPVGSSRRPQRVHSRLSPERVHSSAICFPRVSQADVPQQHNRTLM